MHSQHHKIYIYIVELMHKSAADENDGGEVASLDQTKAKCAVLRQFQHRLRFWIWSSCGRLGSRMHSPYVPCLPFIFAARLKPLDCAGNEHVPRPPVSSGRMLVIGDTTTLQ